MPAPPVPTAKPTQAALDANSALRVIDAISAPTDPCPCGLNRPYAHCCGRWHDGPQRLQAPDAEALMRSRYSAFVRERADYLLDTWHPSHRPATLGFEPGLRWLGLQVLRHTPMGDDRATVAFVARSKLGGRAHRLRETSVFVREQGRWLYVSAEGAA